MAPTTCVAASMTNAPINISSAKARTPLCALGLLAPEEPIYANPAMTAARMLSARSAPKKGFGVWVGAAGA